MLAGKVDLNLAADATGLGVLLDEVVQLLNGVVVRFSANIEHERELRLQVLAHGLEEPLVRVNLAVVPLLDTEHEIDAASTKDGRIDAEIPRRDLETMQKIRGHLLRLDARVHDVTDLLHFELVVAVQFHESLLEEDFFVEETFFARQGLKALRDFLISIADDRHQEVILREVRILIHPEGVVIVDDTAERMPELVLILIVHGDADCHLWVLLTDAAARADLRDHARILDLTMPSVWAEASGTQFLI